MKFLKNYDHAVPKVYVLEPKGRTEVGRHMAYVLNVRENYGLTEGEIGESRSALALKGNPCSARDILERFSAEGFHLYHGGRMVEAAQPVLCHGKLPSSCGSGG